MLDSPGILPMCIDDQAAAIKLAICDDIGERSYDVADVAAILVQMLSRLPTVGNLFLRTGPSEISALKSLYIIICKLIILNH